jgi:ABC-type dipeptide/oligopeptide/nickel transport system permease component
VNEILASGIWVSIRLGGVALLLSLLVGIPAGIFSALRQNTWIDRTNLIVMLALYSIPSFVLIPILRAFNYFVLYQHNLPSLPVAGWGRPAHWVMPVIVLAAANLGYIARLTRSSLLETLQQDYMRTAQAKGLPRRRMIYVHALRNALSPLVTVMGPLLAFLVTGTFVVESLFSIPGIGYLGVQSIAQRDYPVIQGVTVILATAVVLMNLLTDLAYGWLDPRIEVEG